MDAWHHRIIYNNNLSDEIYEWKTLTDKLRGPHSIASDGELILCDDTDNSRLLAFKEISGKYKKVQTVKNINQRPHFIKFDKKTGLFYCLCSLNGEIISLKNSGGIIQIVDRMILNNLKDVYIRSFNIIDGFMYFVSGINSPYI